MKKVALFEKVSFKQFLEAAKELFPDLKEEIIQMMYDSIVKPKRATTGSAGYDFFAPFDFTLQAGETIKVPTGIRVKIKEGWFLGCLPRSGLGFKYRAQLDNTMGVIDSDYYNSDNEGHIMLKVTNDSKQDKVMTVKAGTGFAQGIFLRHGITEDDDVSETRNGGFGSTSKK